MKNRKTYIIADFVKILGIPRTTIKDWLTRYEQYIEFEVRGHRKIYFESSLTVLRDIMKMRDEGKTSPEIIEELAEKHPVNADVAAPHPTENTAQKEPDNFPAMNNPALESVMPAIKQQNKEMEDLLSTKLQDIAADLQKAQLKTLLPIVKQQNKDMEGILVKKLQEMASDLHQAQVNVLMPIVKRQNEKMERLFAGKLQDMASNLHITQLDANQLFRQNSRRVLLIIALVLTLIIAVALSATNIYDALIKQQETFVSSQENINKAISASNESVASETRKLREIDEKQQAKLQHLSTLLERNSKDYSRNIAKLEKGMKTQQDNFENILDKYNQAALKQRKAEIDLLKENFDRERRMLTDKIEVLAKQNVQKDLSVQKESTQVMELKRKIFELHGKIEELKREKEKIEKSITALAPVASRENEQKPQIKK